MKTGKENANRNVSADLLRQVSTLPHREPYGVDTTSFWMYAAHIVE